ncbi:MAG: hypothetical protein HDR24_03585 [Lachnospiraceae bacterium]|nr:hypothetical protein [Lachnospiraceae bacterium]MDE7444835.1 hypothetical protein [Lachnospiraceae bacterium]
MDKKYLHGYIVIAFVFIIYGAAIIPFPKTVIFGIAFFFSLLAIMAQVYNVYTVMKSQTLIKDKIYDFPQIRVSVLYLTVQLLTSLLLMGFSAKVPVFAAVLVEVIILAAAVLGFFAVGAVRKEAVRQDVQLKKELARMEELQTRINLLIAQCGGEQIKDMLQKLSEEIRYSNPISRDSTEEIEDEIDVLFSEVEASALDGNMENTAEVCGRLRGLLKERDRICKYRK